MNMYISGDIVNVSLLTTCSISVTKKLIEMSVLLIKIKVMYISQLFKI